MSAEKSKLFFDVCPEPWRDGYLIPVRNRLNNMIQREYIPEEYKIKYLNKWGEKVIFDDQFVDWYVGLKQREE
ncbi:MAG: hypothetical protein JXB34_14185 [Bacteroidales bacterium]|nr:hypothetical protein [Bacteroidales bacterium]